MGTIRFLLALAVVGAHCGSILGVHQINSHLAVQSFYIISGFYMALILSEKYNSQKNYYSLFLTNRLLKIYPIYFIILFLTFIYYLIVGYHSHWAFVPCLELYPKANFFTQLSLGITNLLIIGQDWVMFFGIDLQGKLFFNPDFQHAPIPCYYLLFIPPAWTLSVELTFYLIAPFIVKKGLKLVVILILLSAAIRLYLFFEVGYKYDPWSYRFFPNELIFFLLGYLSYKLYSKAKMHSNFNKLGIFAYCLLVALVILYPYLSNNLATTAPFAIEEIGYFITFCLAIPFVFIFTKNSKFDAFIGDLSFPIYLSHVLIKQILEGNKYTQLHGGIIIAMVTILFSFFLNHYISKPIEHYRQSRIKL